MYKQYSSLTTYITHTISEAMEQNFNYEMEEIAQQHHKKTHDIPSEETLPYILKYNNFLYRIVGSKEIPKDYKYSREYLHNSLHRKMDKIEEAYKNYERDLRKIKFYIGFLERNIHNKIILTKYIPSIFINNYQGISKLKDNNSFVMTQQLQDILNNFTTEKTLLNKYTFMIDLQNMG